MLSKTLRRYAFWLDPSATLPHRARLACAPVLKPRSRQGLVVVGRRLPSRLKRALGSRSRFKWTVQNVFLGFCHRFWVKGQRRAFGRFISDRWHSYSFVDNRAFCNGLTGPVSRSANDVICNAKQTKRWQMIVSLRIQTCKPRGAVVVRHSHWNPLVCYIGLYIKIAIVQIACRQLQPQKGKNRTTDGLTIMIGKINPMVQ